MKDPRSKTTATAENKLTAEERDEFLTGGDPLVTRFSTIRPDGSAHTARPGSGGPASTSCTRSAPAASTCATSPRTPR